ncbi:MAG: DNA cytosine methyltransferase [Oscillochloris sp.]|nr:DNA cytosine methyltransferase [Oscillochloris sp.]
MSTLSYRFYEFFAGAGMARAGLSSFGMNCIFANDFDHKKSCTYKKNWGEGELRTTDVNLLTPLDLPDYAEFVWASFPCQDLSLAGGGAGLKGDRSGTFWPFWRLMQGLIAEGRAPHVIALENVCGTLTSHGGKDFTTICETFRLAGYRFGALVIDAALFVPQSRPRLFMIGIHSDLPIPANVIGAEPSAAWHPKALRTAFDRLPSEAKTNWLWWHLPTPTLSNCTFANLIEDTPNSVAWQSPAETEQLLGMMSAVNRAKVEQAKKVGRRMVGTIYKRTRRDENGLKAQRAEVRFDDRAGCLRTPAGGSSRQFILVVDADGVKSRLISSRETARLMGLPDTYILPTNYNEAYHLTGDGVVVPVVRHLAEYLFIPLLANVSKGSGSF